MTGGFCRAVDEFTQEKEGPGAGKRSSTRTGFLVGVVLLLWIYLHLELVFALLLLGETEWAKWAGWFGVSTAFVGGTIVPFVVRNWRRKR